DSDAGSSGERPFSHPPTLVSRRMTNQAFTENPAFSSHTRNPIESGNRKPAFRGKRPDLLAADFKTFICCCERRGGVGVNGHESFPVE
ncbi:MAG TPA: hypothetical protein VMV10_03705, partial [Pirellulales bacterium]|nr:hypothetical protein [Pirellulales bacterium]